MRIFFALTLSEGEIGRIEHIQSLLKNRFNQNDMIWVPPQNFHVTVKFIGELDEANLSSMYTAGEDTGSFLNPFSFTLTGPSLFPSRHQPHSIALMCKKEIPELNGLAAVLDEALGKKGATPEARPFRAHLTLARFRDRRAKENSNSLPDDIDSSVKIMVESCSLMKSDLSMNIPRYTVLQNFPLRIS